MHSLLIFLITLGSLQRKSIPFSQKNKYYFICTDFHTYHAHTQTLSLLIAYRKIKVVQFIHVVRKLEREVLIQSVLLSLSCN